jgi:hypothetical protein
VGRMPKSWGRGCVIFEEGGKAGYTGGSCEEGEVGRRAEKRGLSSVWEESCAGGG